MNYYISLLFPIILFANTFANNPNIYYPLDKNILDYRFIEYSIIKNKSLNNVYIFNQPFNHAQIKKIISENDFYYFKNEFSHTNILANEMFYDIDAGLTTEGSSFAPKPYFNISSLFSLDSTYLNFRIELDKRLIVDDEFHGDKDEILTAYNRDAYFLSKFNRLSFFGGRLSRNFGILNEYSLTFSNNPYSFDHYGFSLSGKKTHFSFYVARLNNMKNSVDSDGIIIPADSTANSKRFFSFQNLQFKISDKMQLGLSQSVVYGGPNQNFEAAYINPANFYYVSQRNTRVQLNNSWQLLFYYSLFDNTALYIDFLIDDIIINNDAPNEREKQPDRLGLILKISSTDLIQKKSLSSIIYTRISNDTYTSLRDFENHVYQLKGIGYPYNSYESIKLIQSSFATFPKAYDLKLEFSRKGAVDLFSIFTKEKNDFPLPPILYGIDITASTVFLLKNNVRVFYEFLYRLESDELSSSDFSAIQNHNFKIIYKF